MVVLADYSINLADTVIVNFKTTDNLVVNELEWLFKYLGINFKISP